MGSWREDIVEALTVLGGRGSYEEIYAEVAGIRLGAGQTLTPKWQETVRRTIQSASSDSAGYRSSAGDLFLAPLGIGHGVWELRAASTDLPSSIAENPGTGQGFMVNSVTRRAIEQHAVSAATTYYESLGATEIRELGKPYDLEFKLEDRFVHVEVKGSTRNITHVTLTKNEVLHARGFSQTQLFVLDRIKLSTAADGSVLVVGGRRRLWDEWVPSDDNLVPLAFMYLLP